MAMLKPNYLFARYSPTRSVPRTIESCVEQKCTQFQFTVVPCYPCILSYHSPSKIASMHKSPSPTDRCLPRTEGIRLLEVLGNQFLTEGDVFLLGIIGRDALVDDLLPSLALGLALHIVSPKVPGQPATPGQLGTYSHVEHTGLVRRVDVLALCYLCVGVQLVPGCQYGLHVSFC